MHEKPLKVPTPPVKKQSVFDPRKFLATIGEGRKVVIFAKKQTIFAQGDFIGFRLNPGE